MKLPKSFSEDTDSEEVKNMRPNIVIINPDEMRWNTMGHMGNRAASTPFLDSFAADEAVSFDHAYCQNPVCVPSRCSFFTGLYPHVNGHRTMAHLLRPHETSLLKELKNAGYYVWINARNDLVAGQYEGLAESHASEIFYKPAVSKADKQEAPKKPDPFPYSHFKGVVPNTDETTGDWADTLGAIDRIKHPVDDRPLCLFLGWLNPHPPYTVEQRYYDRIDPEKIEPVISPDETENKCSLMSALRTNQKLDAYTAENWKEMQRVYLAQCSQVDAMFKAVCDALKEAGIYDNTAIIFLSDHGDFAGDYHIPEKAQNTFEDDLTRVPLLIKPPKGEPVDPGITSGMTELVDFYATVMDYAGAALTHDHFGKSLRGVIADRTKTVRKFAFCEGGRRPHENQSDEWHIGGDRGQNPNSEYYPRQLAQSDDDNHTKGTMITDGHHKYIERLNGTHEFYDLDNDPKEKKNNYSSMVGTPVLNELKEAMLHWYQETCDIVPRDYDSRFTPDMIYSMLVGRCPAGKEAEFKAYTRTHTDIVDCSFYLLSLSGD